MPNAVATVLSRSLMGNRLGHHAHKSRVKKNKWLVDVNEQREKYLYWAEFLIIFCVFLGVLWMSVVWLRTASPQATNDTTKSPTLDTGKNDDPGMWEIKAPEKIKCKERDNIPCFDDNDCRMLCVAVFDENEQLNCNMETHVCRYIQHGITDTDPPCDANRGFLSVYSYDAFEANWTCINTNRVLFADDAEIQPWVCGGVLTNLKKFSHVVGEVDSLQPIDYEHLISSCECPPSAIKMRHKYGWYPVCVSSSLEALLPSFFPVK